MNTERLTCVLYATRIGMFRSRTPKPVLTKRITVVHTQTPYGQYWQLAGGVPLRWTLYPSHALRYTHCTMSLPKKLQVFRGTRKPVPFSQHMFPVEARPNDAVTFGIPVMVFQAEYKEVPNEDASGIYSWHRDGDR